MNETIQKLIELFEQLSPKIWAILMKQVYIEATASLFWGLAVGAITLGFSSLGFHHRKKYQKDTYKNDDNSMWAWISWGTAGISMIICVLIMISAIQHFANPEFYAIRFLLQQIPGN
jgi:uncharacterized protein YqhQ